MISAIIKSMMSSVAALALLTSIPAFAQKSAPTRQATPADIARFKQADADLTKAMAVRDWKAAALALRASLEANRAVYGPASDQALVSLETLGIAEQLDGQFARAEAVFREALAARVKRGERGKPASLNALRGLGVSLTGSGQFNSAIPILRETLALQTATSGGETREVALSLNQLGEALTGSAQHQEARDRFAAALAIVQKLSGSDSADAAAALGNLASAEGNLGNHGESIRLNRALLALRKKLSGPKDKLVGVTLNNLGFALAAAGDAAGAEAALRESLVIARATSGEGSVQVATTMNNIASVVQSRGRLAEAERIMREALAILTKQRGPTHPESLRTEGNLATIMQEQGKYGEAEAVFRRIYAAQSTALGPAHVETLNALSNLASSLESQGRVGEAEALNRKALTAAAGNGQNGQYAILLSNLATAIGNQGRFDEALALHRQALTLREKLLGKDHPDVALSLTNIGYILAQKRDYSAADDSLRRAVAIGRKTGGSSLSFSSLLNNFGANLDDLNRHGEAETALKECLSIRRNTLPPTHPLIATSLNNLGNNARLRGQNAAALQLFREALGIMRKVSGTSDPDLLVPLDNLAMILSTNRKTAPEALSLAREGAKIVRARRLQLISGNGIDAASGAAARAKGDTVLSADPFVTAFIAQVETGWESAKYEPATAPALRREAFMAAQEIDVPQAAQALARTAARTAAATPALAQLVGRQQSVSREINAGDDRYLALAAAGDAAGAQLIEAELRQRAAELALIDAKLAKDFPAYQSLIAPTALSVDEVRTHLQPDEGVLFILPSNGHLHSFAVGPSGDAWHRAEGGVTATRPIIARLLCQIDPVTCEPGSEDRSAPSPAELAGGIPYDRTAAYGLYKDLVAPVEAPLAGAKRVYVAVVGELGKLPLGLLLTQPPQAGTDSADSKTLRDSPWLADRYALTLLPAVSSLRFAGKAAGPNASGKAFVGYGAPDLKGQQLPAVAMAAARGAPLYLRSGADAVANPAIVNQLSPLPGTRVELTAMALALGAQAGSNRLAGQATETRLKSDPDLANSRVVAFATHGLLPGELTGANEPALVLTPPRTPSLLDDGLLSASEIATLSLSADWVILSACNTAAAGAGAESLSGLARAFLFAGAKSLLATHWRVDDQATAQLTVEALKADKSMTRAAALQSAMTAIRTGKRQDGSAIEGWKPQWAHPAYWAPFSVISNVDR